MTTTDLSNTMMPEETCPLCWRKNQISKLVPIFYKLQEAIYTCENVNCIYFITDHVGNLKKYQSSKRTLVSNCEPERKSFTGDTIFEHPTKVDHLTTENSSTAYLDDIFNGQSKDADIESIINELSSDLKQFMEN